MLAIFAIINSVLIKILQKNLCAIVLRGKSSVFSLGRDSRLDMKDVFGKKTQRRLKQRIRGVRGGCTSR